MKIYEKLMRRLRKMFGKRKFKGIKVGTKLRIVWYSDLVTTMEVVENGQFVHLENRHTKQRAYVTSRIKYIAGLVESIEYDVESGTIQRYEIIG